MSKRIEIESLRAESMQRKKKQKLIITIICAIAVLALVVTLFIFPLNYDKIYKDVCVAGVEVGEMTEAEALDVLNKQFSDTVPKIKIIAGNNEMDIDFNVIAEYDLEETAKDAFKQGRKNIFTKFGSYYFGGKNIDIHTGINMDALKEIIGDFQGGISDAFRDTEFKIDDDILIVKAGKSGNTIDVNAVADEIIKSIKMGKDAVVDAKIINMQYSGIDVDELYDDVYTEAKDAYYDKDSSKIVPHVTGYSFDKDEAKKILKNAESSKEYKIQLVVTYPSVTEETLTGQMFSDTLASYSTKYNPGEVDRTHNMSLASARVNGTVIAPGEVFSYNNVVGERTVAKGYRNAKVFENGRVVDGLAGGICQVSTTIYNAALYANLEIVERKNHSFPVTYAPMGQDATVVMGAIDFRFRNNTSSPIKVVSSVSGGICTVTILGTDKDHYKVEIQNTTTGTTPRPVRYENDPSLEPGVEKVTQSGSDGYSVVSKRIVSKNGKVVKTESIPSSYYIPLEKIIARNEEAATEENPEDVTTEENPEDGTVPSDDETVTPSGNEGNGESTQTPPVEEGTVSAPEITPEADPNTGV